MESRARTSMFFSFRTHSVRLYRRALVTSDGGFLKSIPVLVSKQARTPIYEKCSARVGRAVAGPSDVATCRGLRVSLRARIPLRSALCRAPTWSSPTETAATPANIRSIFLRWLRVLYLGKMMRNVRPYPLQEVRDALRGPMR